MSWAWILLLAILAPFDAATPSASKPRISVVRVHPRFAVQATDVTVLVRVPRHPANRTLVFNFEGDTGYEHNSLVQLRGDKAPELHEFRVKQAPPGRYVIRVWMSTAEGRLGKSYSAPEERMVVYGPGVDPEGGRS